MKKTIFLMTVAMAMATAQAKDVKVVSPNGNLVVTVTDEGGKPAYFVELGGQQMLDKSALGLKTNIGDFTEGLAITGAEQRKVTKDYTMTRTKASSGHYVANQATISLVNKEGYRIDLTMNVSDNDVAYRYTLPGGKGDNPKCAVIYSEA